jgi:hypothetical protein
LNNQPAFIDDLSWHVDKINPGIRTKIPIEPPVEILNTNRANLPPQWLGRPSA